MPTPPRRLAVLCATAVLVVGCTQTVAGTATRSPSAVDEGSLSPVDVETVMLDKAQMRAITGAGEDLTIVPTMDGKIPVDIEPLAKGAPAECRWIFTESQTFGRDVEDFHKTTFQNPPKGGLISEGAAAYRDANTAQRAFEDLVGLVGACGSSEYGPTYVGEWTAEPDSLHTRPYGGCGRDYRVKSVVLVEVTFCAFPASVPEIVIANMMARVPG